MLTSPLDGNGVLMIHMQVESGYAVVIDSGSGAVQIPRMDGQCMRIFTTVEEAIPHARSLGRSREGVRVVPVRVRIEFDDESAMEPE